MPQPLHIASTDNVQVALHDLGGTGPPLLIVHATGFLGMAYAPLARSLTANFSVWSADLRGHGDSITPDRTSMSWWGMFDDVLAIADHLGGQLSAFGHSMGGAAILGAEMMRSGTFTSAYTFEPIVFPSSAVAAAQHQDSHIVQAARRRRAEFESFDAAFERYSHRPPMQLLDPEVLRLYVDHGFRGQPNGSVTLKCSPETEASVFACSHVGIFDRLLEVHIPVAVACGRDESGPPVYAPGIADELPAGTFYRDDSLSHFGPFEQPARVGNHVREFLTR
jgi:pimeloyl-ACP methyl ester carboxylesterase